MSATHARSASLSVQFITLLLLLSATVMPASLAGQEDRPANERLWIRLTTRGGDSASAWLVGRVEILTPDHILLQPIGVPPLWMSERSLVRIERHDGWRRRPVLRSGLLGALFGLAAGLALDRVAGVGAPCYASIPVGTGIGLGIGASGRTWRWTPVTFAILDYERERSAVGWRIGVLLAASR